MTEPWHGFLPKLGGFSSGMILRSCSPLTTWCWMLYPSDMSSAQLIGHHPLSDRAPRRQRSGVDNPGHRQPRRQSLSIRTISYTDSPQPRINPSTPLVSTPDYPSSAMFPRHQHTHPSCSHLPTPPPPGPHHASSSPFPHPNNDPSFLLSTLRLSICPQVSHRTSPFLAPKPKPRDLPKASYNPDTPCARQPRPFAASLNRGRSPGPEKLTGNNPDTWSCPPRSCADTGCSCARPLGRGRGIRFSICCWFCHWRFCQLPTSFWGGVDSRGRGGEGGGGGTDSRIKLAPRLVRPRLWLSRATCGCACRRVRGAAPACWGGRGHCVSRSFDLAVTVGDSGRGGRGCSEGSVSVVVGVVAVGGGKSS